MLPPLLTRKASERKDCVVILPFESMEAAQAHYNSAEYQEAKSFRDGAAKAQFFLVEGAD